MKKNMKKIMALALAATMTLGMTTVGMAQDATLSPASTDNATITISNASKGETYMVYKLFDATVTGTTDGSIAYQGDIPSDLTAYFGKDTAGNVFIKEGVDNKALFAALKTWASEDGEGTAVISEISDGSALNFKGLDYGYYVVTSTQDRGASITVNSTNPNVTIYDKNSTEITDLSKTVNDDNVKIGEEITYTVKFETANYVGSGEDAEQVISYTIKDTLPEYLSDVTVTSIYVDNDGNLETETDQTVITTKQFSDKEIVIDWATAETVDGETVYTNLYKNRTTLVVTYTADVNEKIAIAGSGNKNEVTVQWTTAGNSEPENEKLTTEEVIYSYALALKKVDDQGKALAGATFEFPFYVKPTEDNTDGETYYYAGTTAGTGLTNTITTPDNGEIVVLGVEANAEGETYSIEETVAPNGYNKLTAKVEVPVVKTSETKTSVTKYIDENGKVTDTETTTKVTYTNDNIAASVVVVVNKTGVELPSTGGMGTTIFYILGSIMALGAGVLLVTKKRVGEN